MIQSLATQRRCTNEQKKVTGTKEELRYRIAELQKCVRLEARINKDVVNRTAKKMLESWCMKPLGQTKAGTCAVSARPQLVLARLSTTAAR